MFKNTKNEVDSVLKGKYDYIFSLGQACSCSTTLRQAHLQFRSLPFDWIAGAELVERCRIIESDFSSFLIKDEMEVKPQAPNKPNPVGVFNSNPVIIYLNKKNGLIFRHDFLLSDDFDYSFDKVKKKYDRRIERFLSKVENSRRVLAVYIDIPYTTRVLTDDSLIEAHKILKNRFPNVDIDMIYIHNDENIPYTKHEIRYVKGKEIIATSFCYNAYNKNAPEMVNYDILMSYLSGIRISWRHQEWKDIFRMSNISKIKRFFYNSKITDKGYHIIKIMKIIVWRKKVCK